MNFSQNVNKILTDKGISKTDLAKKMGKSRQNISVILKKNYPNLQTMTEFSNALDVSIDELMNTNLPINNFELFKVNGLIDVRTFVATQVMSALVAHYGGSNPDSNAKMALENTDALIKLLTIGSN